MTDNLKKSFTLTSTGIEMNGLNKDILKKQIAEIKNVFSDYSKKVPASKPVTEKETPVSLEVTEDIERPQRYNKGSIEVWDFILDQSMGFLEGNIIKYISRYKEKGGIKDLEKAKVYLEKLIEETKKNE